MKNENVKKINTLGKISKIVLMVFRVCSIIGIVCSIIGLVAVAFIPKDAIRVDGKLNGSVTIDGSKIPMFFISDSFDPETANLKIGLNDWTFDIGDNTDVEFDGLNVKMDIDRVDEDNLHTYTVDGTIDMEDGGAFKLTAILFCVAGITGSIVMLIVSIFGGKLAKALEKCDSPFEENVLKSMKHFAFSLIPFGIAMLAADGIVGISSAIFIAAIILITFVFKYGADLQKQSDETV